MTRKRNVSATDNLSPRVTELLTMLQYQRPAGSKNEARFIARFIEPLGCLPDEYGNHWLTVGNGSPVLWSSHTDTVHDKSGQQGLIYGDGIVSVKPGANCLGADCTVGVWLMMNMIRAGIPGTYVFHASEEIGGLGSEYIATETPERLANLQFAIAFDRKGTNEIITHQMGSRCASDVFADSLAAILHPLPYVSSDGGTFTDTANYSRIVPECTNISVGYRGQHTAKETLDVHHACALLDRILSTDWSRLTCSRDPAVDDDMWSGAYGITADYRDIGDDAFARYVRNNSRAVADFLEANGFCLNDVEDYVWGTTDIGVLKCHS